MLTRLRHTIHTRLDFITHTRIFHKGHVLAHSTYFSFVFLEGHGMYAAMGGAMAIFTVALALTGQGD